MVGAKTKLNPGIQDAICSHLENGKTVESACGAVGITDRTFYNWLKKGKTAKSGKFKKFYEAVTIAQEKAISNFEAVVIQSVIDGNVNDAKWWLERRVKDYQKTNKVKADVNSKSEVEINNRFFDEDLFNKIIEEYDND